MSDSDKITNRSNFTVGEVKALHESYCDHTLTVKSICDNNNIKCSTLIRYFKLLGLYIRPKGFRKGNCRGKDGNGNLRLRYLWFKKFAYERRAKRKQIKVEITDDQFISLVTGDCFYCGKSYLSETRVVNKNKINMLTIDRLDSNIGYVYSNCVTACKICNTIKMDQNVEDFKLKVVEIYNHMNLGELSGNR